MASFELQGIEGAEGFVTSSVLAIITFHFPAMNLDAYNFPIMRVRRNQLQAIL